MDNETVSEAEHAATSASLIKAAMKKTTSSVAARKPRAKREPLVDAQLAGAGINVLFTVRRSDAMQCAQWLSERAVEQRRRKLRSSDATSVRVKQVTRGVV